MATNPIRGDGRNVTPLVPGLRRVFTSFDRDTLAIAITVAINVLDFLEGEADAEDEDPAGQCDEDDLNTDLAFAKDDGAGCIISDSDCCVAGDDKIVGSWDDQPGDPDDAEVAHAEWQSLPGATRRSGAVDGKPKDGFGSRVGEDDEDDDSDTGVEDGPKGFDPEEDHCAAHDDGCGPVYVEGRRRWGSEHEDGDYEERPQPATWPAPECKV